jgi:hypothetical protein
MKTESPFSGWKRGADGPLAVDSQAQVPLFKGGRRCFRRYPQVADHEDFSLVGHTTRRLAGCSNNAFLRQASIEPTKWDWLFLSLFQSMQKNRKPLLWLEKGRGRTTAVDSQARVPLFKGGRRCFRRHPQVADRKDFSLVGHTTRRLAKCDGTITFTEYSGKQKCSR